MCVQWEEGSERRAIGEGEVHSRLKRLHKQMYYLNLPSSSLIPMQVTSTPQFSNKSTEHGIV